MGIDITIGQSGTLYHPLFPCHGNACLKDPTCACRDTVRQQRHLDAPEIEVATAQGMKHGGFNFYALSYGAWARYLEEIGLADIFNSPDYPCTIPITQDMVSAFVVVARRFMTGDLTTKYTEYDDGLTRWFVFWLTFALSTYGANAAIELS